MFNHAQMGRTHITHINTFTYSLKCQCLSLNFNFFFQKEMFIYMSLL